MITNKCIPVECLFPISDLIAINRLSYPKQFSDFPIQTDFWEIRYVLRGMDHVIIDSTEYDLSTHQAIFIPPHAHSNTANGSNSSSIVGIVSFVCDAPSMDFFRNKIFIFDRNERDLFFSLLTERKHHLERKDDAQCRCLRVREDAPDTTSQLIKVNIECLLTSLYFRYADNVEATNNFDSIDNTKRIIQDVLDYMSTHIMQNITLDEISSALNVSVSTLRKKFKNDMKESIINYFINMKIDHAAQMIRESSMSITEIAELHNFSSLNYFSKVFKAKIGLTPSEYSKRY